MFVYGTLDITISIKRPLKRGTGGVVEVKVPFWMLWSQEVFLNPNLPLLWKPGFQMSGPMVSSRNVAAESKKRCSKRKDASASLTSASAASVTKGFQIEESISTKFPLRPDVSACYCYCYCYWGEYLYHVPIEAGCTCLEIVQFNIHFNCIVKDDLQK